MAKITEKIIEPDKIYTGSIFKLKVKIEKSRITYADLKKVKCNKLKNLKCKDIKEA